jgi:hypothetical protein
MLEVIARNQLIGTLQLSQADFQFYGAQGAFAPTHAFEPFRAFFAEAPQSLLFYDLLDGILGDDVEDDANYITFVKHVQALDLVVLLDGHRIPGVRLLGIGPEGPGRWQAFLRAESVSAFAPLTREVFADAGTLFATYTRLWNADLTAANEMDEKAIAEPVQRALDVLARPQKNNPVFVGEARVVRYLAVQQTVRRVMAGDCQPLVVWQVATLASDELLALPDENARRTLEAIVWRSAETQPRTLLVVDPFDVLLPWATPVLKPLLARGHMRLIGTAGLEEYRAKVEKDAAIQRRMQEIIVRQ